SKVTLPDGTVVWLNAATTFICPTDYNKKTRTVNLSGEAYFEVKKKENIPFVVYAKDYPLLVKGTKFNVTAYPEEQVLTAALLEGLLQFGDDEPGLLMHPNDVVTYDLSLNAKSIYSTYAKQFISWTEGRIEYDSITFDELFRRLSRQYDVDIIFTSERKTDKVLNISLNNGETITDVLNALSLIIPMAIERDGRTLTITFK
ncbi:FecR family protein, partial [Escherichia coli]